MSLFSRFTRVAFASAGLLGCGSNQQDIQGYGVEARIANQDLAVAAADVSLSAEAGDVVRLDIVAFTSDGDKVAAPAGAQIEWSGMPAMMVADPTGSGMTPMSSMQGATDAFRVENPMRFGGFDRDAVVALLGSGATNREVQANVSGVEHAGMFSVHIATSEAPSGDAQRGGEVFSANCARCHGSTGAGSGDFPCLNTNSDVTGDPGWGSALFAVAARVGMDDEGVPLSSEMPTWLTQPAANGKLLTTQDFADMYAFLKTQQ